MAKEKKEKPLKKHSIIVKYEHLNPALQEIIGEKARIKDLLINSPALTVGPMMRKIIRNKVSLDEVMASPMSDTIRRLRNLRALLEGGSLFGLLLMLDAIKTKNMRKAKIFGGGTSYIIAVRTFVAKWIQWKHRGLVKVMKDHGILQTKYEKGYPKDWINPTTVAKTHPTFYVQRNGDLIFPRMSRTEYARYVFQKRFPGKLGLNPWRWRAYLEPPERPEKVADFVNAKIRKWLAAMRPRPAFGISQVRPTKRALPKRRKKQIRRRL